MSTNHGVARRRLISSPVASLRRTVLLLLACLLLTVTFSSWCLKLSGGLVEPPPSKLQLAEHRHRFPDTSLFPQRRKLVDSSGENCTRMCGNVPIPYPFGLSPECARDSYFQLQCRNTSGVTGYKAQIIPGYYPFLTNGVRGSFQENGTILPRREHLLDSFQVLGINLTDATIVLDTTRIKASSCDYVKSDFNSTHLGNASILLPSKGPYRLTSSNLFVVVGCQSMGRYYNNPIGNRSVSNYGFYDGQCGPNSCANPTSFAFCNGYDCCVSSITPSLSFYLVGGGIEYPGISTCGYASLVYPLSYSTNFSAHFYSATYGAQLMWALPVEENFSNCSLLQRSAEYACSPWPATCINVNVSVTTQNFSDLVGYYCQCLQGGYKGDGYINGTGCEDIDECEDPSLNQCTSEAVCKNNNGSYGCLCPAGMHGDGFFNGTRCYHVGDKGRRTALIIGGVIGGILVLLSACVSLLVIWRLKKRLSTLEEFQQALKDRQVQPPFFSYYDLKSATNNFSESSKLGAGAFGAVYKGILRDGTSIAVKRLFNNEQVLNDFLNEVVLITGIKHKNLVQLKGCCITDKERLLIYEYAENGNVAQALWGKDTEETLDWMHRLNICMGIARGLSYLHEELQPRIIHRDIKPANILLDHHWNSKIADFGLAKPVMEEESQAAFTFFAGTKGYLAPEYVLDGQLTAKADVYSFGILVLEIISGRKSIDLNLPPHQVSLKNMAQDLQNMGKALDLMDPELNTSTSKTDVMKIINIALACVQTNPSHRPTMSQVVSMLLGIMEATTFSNYDEDKSALNALDVILKAHHHNEESISYETTPREELEDSGEAPFLRSQSFPVRVRNRVRGDAKPESTRTIMTELSPMVDEYDRFHY